MTKNSKSLRKINKSSNSPLPPPSVPNATATKPTTNKDRLEALTKLPLFSSHVLSANINGTKIDGFQYLISTAKSNITQTKSYSFYLKLWFMWIFLAYIKILFTIFLSFNWSSSNRLAKSFYLYNPSNGPQWINSSTKTIYQPRQIHSIPTQLLNQPNRLLHPCQLFPVRLPILAQKSRIYSKWSQL